MSLEERAWLTRAASSQAVETVLKQGEVLYIPSHWFHYIISLQKSAQCNVRSGIDLEGTTQFGGRREVEECK
jgi:Cupin-like domain